MSAPNATIAGVPDPSRVSDIALAMWVHDTASQSLGMELIDVRPGNAILRMPVRHDFLNGLGSCHGGYMFLLADSAFAFACNSHNRRAVAAGAQIEFLAPPLEGDVLTARAEEVHAAGRTGFYDVTVTDQNGRRVAIFRGRSAIVKGEHLPSGAGAGTGRVELASPSGDAPPSGDPR
jgi:acyl-CoA thioesterase